MNKRIILFVLILLFIAFESFLFTNKKKNASDESYEKAFRQSNKVFGIVLPEKINFCNEETPLSLYYVREGLDRELTVNSYFHSSTLLLLKKTNRYLHTITPILKKNNIPDDFKYLAMIESSFSNAVSSKGAGGVWQFMPETAKRYGLEVTDQVDERYNLEKSTQAACNMLNDFYKKFGSWTLAAAAYNVGENRIARDIEKQNTNIYYNLYLPSETMRYVFRILSMKLIYENPTQYGFYIRNKDMYPIIPTYTITIDTSINNLVEFAKSKNINYLILKDFNPWLRSDKLLNPSKKTYNIQLPKPGFEDIDNLIDKIDHAEQIFNDTIHVKYLIK